MDSARAAVRERDERVARSVGRTARLRLWFEQRGGKTILADAYAEPPFCVRRSFDRAGAAHVIIVCSGPGVFGGDVLSLHVHVGAGARVVLTSQSSLQVHPDANGLPAFVNHRYTVADDGDLQCEWHATIPFAGSRLRQTFDVQAAESARLWWSEAAMSGRAGRGERWQFRELAHELRVMIDRSLQYLERYRIAPAERHPAVTWVAGDADYFGTCLLRHPSADRELAEAMHLAMLRIPDVRAAADLVAPRLIAVRCMSARGVPFSAARAACRAAVPGALDPRSV